MTSRQAFLSRHRSDRRRLLRDERGAALVEMAMVLPVLMLLIMGIIVYGQWLACANALQQSANEGARASLSGLSQEERALTARQTVADSLSHYDSIDQRKVAIGIQDDGTTLNVTVNYDMSDQSVMKLPFVPIPDKVLSRSAAVRLASF
ncbi:TadE/TadG family type IV pilus assembly protein [Sphingomonas pruni]|uniref:TadE/TadG family type IV pilus assembly protein n=1 Tax=Sphingomonas pruni TaxID=40683 RepID=UPI0008377447|nr:TadE/TadG family type IV pilus assembly protein [Sphingomonas pruni]